MLSVWYFRRSQKKSIRLFWRLMFGISTWSNVLSSSFWSIKHNICKCNLLIILLNQKVRENPYDRSGDTFRYSKHLKSVRWSFATIWYNFRHNLPFISHVFNFVRKNSYDDPYEDSGGRMDKSCQTTSQFGLLIVYLKEF